MNVSTEWLLGILFALVFGAYGWSTGIGGWMVHKIDGVRDDLSKRIDELRTNHIAHLEERVKQLEQYHDDERRFP